MAPRLGLGSLPEEVRSLALANVDECLELLEDAQAHPAKSIHECRKRLKRLRALLRACRPTLSKRQFMAQDDRFREASRYLSAPRARAAQREALGEVAAYFGLPEPERAAVSSGLAMQLPHVVEEQTRDARRAAHRLLGQSGRDVGQWLHGLKPRKSAEALTTGMVSQWKKARDAYLRALEHPDSELVHRWRRHVKYHLHQLQLARSKSCGFHKRIEELQDLAELLGQAHDLADLRVTLGPQGDVGEGEPHWLALLRAREAELTLEALERGRSLFSRSSSQLFKQVQEALLES